MELTQRASKGVILNQVSKLAEALLLFLFSIVAARGLGAPQYGVYSFVVGMSSLVILISMMGLDETITVFIPKLRDEKQRASFLFKRLLVTRLASSMVAGVIYFVLADKLAALFGNQDLAYYFRLSILYIIVTNLTAVFLSYFMGRIDLKIIALTRVVGASASLIAVYFILKMGYGITGIIVVSILVGLCVLAMYVFKALSFLRVPGEEYPLARVYRFGFAVWLTVILDYALGKQIDIILLQYFGVEEAQIGFYNIAFSMYRALAELILAGLGGIGLASISEIYIKYGVESTANAWSILAKLGLLLLFPLRIFTIVHARSIISVCFSEEFLGAALLLQVAMLFGLPNRLLASGINTGVLYGIGKERVVLYFRLIAGVSNLVLDCLLIPDHIGPLQCAGLGPLGAIIATLSTGLVMHFAEFLMTRSLIPTRYPIRLSVVVVGASFVAGVLTWKMGTGTLLGLLIAVGIFLLSYAVIVMALRPLSRYDAEVMSRVLPGFVEKLKKWNVLFGNE